MATATKKKKTAASGVAGGGNDVRPAPAATPVLDHITPDLRPLAVPIDSIRLDVKNARLHPEQNRKAVAQTLKEDGQQLPIIVDGDGIIIVGNCRWEEAKKLGWTHVAVVKTHLTGAAARRWAIRDNRTAELAEWDEAMLKATLEELQADLPEFNIDDLGFSQEQMDALVDGDMEFAHGFVPQKPQRETPAKTLKMKFDIYILCKSEEEQAERIAQLQKLGLEYGTDFTAPGLDPT